jgi:hypothetical protein
MMKESAIASSKTESERAKKRYDSASRDAIPELILCSDSALVLLMYSSQKKHWLRKEHIVRVFHSFN